MSDKRPVELASYIEAAAEKNDALILEALAKLEDPQKSGKLKPTVSALCTLTKLSRNTIRNRLWALERLKAIKLKRKNRLSEPVGGELEAEDDVAILKSLRGRIKTLLEQNAVLYEEVLSLRRTIERKDAEINELSVRRLERVV